MLLTLLKGYPDFIGRRSALVGYGAGPSSYNQNTGDQIALPLLNWYIDSVEGTPMSVSGTYFVRAQPSGVGPRQRWSLHWFVTSTGNEVSSLANLSAEQVQLRLTGGPF